MNLEDAFNGPEEMTWEATGPHGFKMYAKKVKDKKKKEEEIPQADTGAKPKRETPLWSKTDKKVIGKADVEPDWSIPQEGESPLQVKMIEGMSREAPFFPQPKPKLKAEEKEILGWLASLGGNRAAQISALRSNKVLRRKLGIDDMWFQGLVRRATAGDEVAQAELDNLVAPALSKPELASIEKKRGEGEAQKRSKQELEQRRGELVLQEEFNKRKEGRKLENDKAITMFRSTLKNQSPDALSSFDKKLDVFDTLMEQATAPEQIEENARQAFGDNIPPMIEERGAQFLSGDRKREARQSAEANLESWEKAKKAIDEAAKDLYNKPEEMESEFKQIVLMYGLSPQQAEQLRGRMKRYSPSEKQKAEDKYFALMNRGGPYNPLEQEFMERYTRYNMPLMDKIMLGQGQPPAATPAPAAKPPAPAKPVAKAQQSSPVEEDPGFGPTENGTLHSNKPDEVMAEFKREFPGMTAVEEHRLRINPELFAALQIKIHKRRLARRQADINAAQPSREKK